MDSKTGPHVVMRSEGMIIVWEENPVRWIGFYYLLGLVFSCFLMFIEEILFPLPVSNLLKILFLTLLAPILVIAWSILQARGRRRHG